MSQWGTFPKTRLRRLRQNKALRQLVNETELNVSDLIHPLFIRFGTNIKQPILSMPGHYQLSVDQLDAELDECIQLGIKALILFGIPEYKDAEGSASLLHNGVIQNAIRHIKKRHPNMLVIADVCLCEYTDHGHCGVLAENDVLNDQTLALLNKQAISLAKAGIDIIAPSGMIDGMVKSIRSSLDEAGFSHLPILSYSVKYASSMYGPFRDAAEGAPKSGDRKSHQMHMGNTNEALRECGLDIEEGADMLMVKPAHTYLDVIARVKQQFPSLPLGAYHTSGEFAMIKAAAEKGWVDEKSAIIEVLTAIKRAGADFIITYFAKEFARN